MLFDLFALSFRWCRRIRTLRWIIWILLRIDIALSATAVLSEVIDMARYGLRMISTITVILALFAFAIFGILTFLISVYEKCREYWEVA